MPIFFGLTGNEDDNAVSATSFNDLPNEMMSKIFEELSLEDRANLAATNERLNDVERKTGYRRFDRIIFGPMRPQFPFEENNNHHLKIFPDDLASIEDMSSYLKHAIAKRLWILDPIDHRTEKTLSIAFQTVKFQELFVYALDNYSGRIISDLVKDRKCIRKLDMCWFNLGINGAEDAKKALVGLPPINEYRISSPADLVDDEIFLHLVKNSRRVFLHGKTIITAQGLAKAFEIVCGSKEEKVVKVWVPTTVVNEFIRRLDPDLFIKLAPNDIFHRNSGARLYCYASFPQGVNMRAMNVL